MVPLARACAALGHDVRWATSVDGCAHVAAAGITAVPAGLSPESIDALVQSIRTAATGVRPEDRAAFVFPRMFGAAATPIMFADLLPIARDWGAQLLVHEHAELAAPLVGALLGIPAVTHAYGGAIPAAILDEARERLAPLWDEHGLSIPDHAGCFTAPYLDICPPRVQTVATDHITNIQPLRPVPYTGEPTSELPDVLAASGAPLVYVTLGTVQGQAANQVAVLQAVIDGLNGLGVGILVTVGPGGDPGALGRQPAHVTVRRFVSQTDVLPRCAAVVSHAGSGTVLGALDEGLPQLCLPQAADQFRNAEGVVAAGAGLALHPTDATPDLIGSAVRRIMGEERFRHAAAGIADDIRAMPSPEDVAAVLVGLT
jgi:UDP:flavonoid glycosyltransferase YjiC (YdhE family)